MQSESDRRRRHTPIDISVLVSATTPEWPGDTPFSCGWTWDMAAGATVQLSTITMSPHVGTHADSPLHVRPGAAGSDALPLDAFVGEVLICTLDGEPRDVEMAELSGRVPAGTERLLLRTDHCIAAGTFPEDWPALSARTASSLAGGGLKLLGVDAPSVDRRHSTSLGTHHALFDGGANVLENLDLRGVTDGVYLLVALPLRIHGLDASPVRALLYPATSPPVGGNGRRTSVP